MRTLRVLCIVSLSVALSMGAGGTCTGSSPPGSAAEVINLINNGLQTTLAITVVGKANGNPIYEDDSVSITATVIYDQTVTNDTLMNINYIWKVDGQWQENHQSSAMTDTYSVKYSAGRHLIEVEVQAYWAVWDVTSSYIKEYRYVSDLAETTIQVEPKIEDTGGICGLYPDDGSGLSGNFVVYGEYSVYQGVPVDSSNAAIYVGQYVGYNADYDFYPYLQDDVEITWGLDGDGAEIVPYPSAANQVYIHALGANTVKLCVMGRIKSTGEVRAYRAVPIRIDLAGFSVSRVDVYRPEYTLPTNNVFFLVYYTGQLTKPAELTINKVSSSCIDHGGLPCYLTSGEAGDAYSDAVIIGYDLTSECAAIGNIGSIHLSFNLQDAAGAIAVPFEFDYSCVVPPQ